MITVNINQFVNRDGVVFQKNRKVHRSDIEFVLALLNVGLSQPECKAVNSFTLGDIAGAGLWLDSLERNDRKQLGLCLSWLVDRGLVPLVKLAKRRGNTLLYNLNPTH